MPETADILIALLGIAIAIGVLGIILPMVWKRITGRDWKR